MARPGELTSAVLADLRDHFTERQLLELTLDVMKWNYQKVSVALGTDREVRPGRLADLRFDLDGNPEL